MNKNKINYSITHKSTVFKPYERMALGMHFLIRFLYLQRMKDVQFNVDEEKISISGSKTVKAGDFHLDIKREDFRGSSVDFYAFNLIGIIISSLIMGTGIFLLIIYFADLFGNDSDTLPLGLGIIIIVLGILVLIISLLKHTLLTLRFVDKNSNSVRYLAVKVRRNAKDYYSTAKDFTEKIWLD